MAKVRAKIVPISGLHRCKRTNQQLTALVRGTAVGLKPQVLIVIPGKHDYKIFMGSWGLGRANK